ncbi:MAG: helix-turn-helix domain-containing protein [Betaproteobacteria bacterium]|nr:helix-turn-helix domain-containing protein [Betaproteobacteria bacterium]
MAQVTELIGSSDACRILGRDKATLSRWVRDGRIRPAIRSGGHRNSAFLFHRADVEDLARRLDRS